MELYFTLCVIVSRILYVYSYGSGAPSAACINLRPGHGVSGQSSARPYTVTLSKATYEENGPITVTVTGNGGHQGLLVQARKNDGTSSTPVGTFSQPSANTKTTGCSQSADSWTHSSTASKQTSTAVWTAPSSNVGQIVFKATVAASKTVYWLNIESAVVEFSLPTTTPEATTPEATTPEATSPEATSPEATTPEATTPTATTPTATTTAATSPEATTPEATTPEASSPEATTQEATTPEATTNTTYATNSQNDSTNGHGKNHASCLFTLVAMVTSILLIIKY